MPIGAFNAMDRHVGRSAAAQREARAMTLEDLADPLGLSAADLQCHENGSERIGASRLHRIAGILGVPVTFFFESPAACVPGSGARAGVVEPAAATTAEAVELLALFNRIGSPEARRAVLDFARTAAESAGNA